ncbi:beta-1,4-glucuronyltransferase 1-like isoform X2 [Portunus trituberculatus]|uniref:beta-1,4-glucuronyltransferase 1-like isoform X2 n=1 Tax=Portunus trituberculatus TaxID=210409 RepID=UPI001E1CF772|nr:beta-1,4-glucuronyltransferase 1-like isoform X2 [Portunus trituberculatus]
MKYFARPLRKVCGRQCFLVVNVVVVAVNLCLGLMVNLAFMSSSSSPPPLTTTLAAPDNLTTLMRSGGTVPAAYGLTDASGNFTSHAFVWAGRAWQEVVGTAQVCMATHASTQHLHWIATHARRWSGPISVAVYAAGGEYVIAAGMVSYLRQCVEGVDARVSFHLVHPRGHPPESTKSLPPVVTCGNAEEVNRIMVAVVGLTSQRYPRYPQNLLRNVAWRACHTPHVFNVDVDMIPVPEMYPRLSDFLGSRVACGRCAYVVPVYEVSSKVSQPPQDKMELLRLLLSGKARRFHLKVYQKNQGNTHLEHWEVERHAFFAYQPFSVLFNISSYEEFWEPVLVLPRGSPPFDERFIGYGFTRSSQVYELHVRGYHFSVLDEPFLTHLGFQTTASYPTSRFAQIEINHIRYQMFKKELHARLGLPLPPPLPPPASRVAARIRLMLRGRKREEEGEREREGQETRDAGL